MAPNRVRIRCSSEYFAIRNGATLFDVSPLIKYRIQGREAARYVDHLVTRDVTKVKPMQVFYTAWCDDDGMLVEEGTLFRLGENDFILNAALHQYAWLKETAYGFDVTIEDMTDDLCGLALQGPKSRHVLRAFGVTASTSCRISACWKPPSTAAGCASIAPATPAISAMRSGSSRRMRSGCGTRCSRSGEPYKIAPMGSAALNIARIEAGFILVDVDYFGALLRGAAEQPQVALRARHRLDRQSEQGRLLRRQARAASGRRSRASAAMS